MTPDSSDSSMSASGHSPAARWPCRRASSASTATSCSGRLGAPASCSTQRYGGSSAICPLSRVGRPGAHAAPGLAALVVHFDRDIAIRAAPPVLALYI